MIPYLLLREPSQEFLGKRIWLKILDSVLWVCLFNYYGICLCNADWRLGRFVDQCTPTFHLFNEPDFSPCYILCFHHK